MVWCFPFHVEMFLSWLCDTLYWSSSIGVIPFVSSPGLVVILFPLLGKGGGVVFKLHPVLALGINPLGGP